MLPITLCGGNGVVMSSGPPTLRWKSDNCVKVCPCTVMVGPGSWLRPRPGAVCPWAGVAANGTAASSASREDIAPALTRVMHPPTRAPLYGASRVAGAPFRSGARRLFTPHFLRSLAPRVTERHVTLRNTSRPHLTELQQAILDIVWSKKAATADAVREALQPLALASDLPGPPDLPDPPD